MQDSAAHDCTQLNHRFTRSLPGCRRSPLHVADSSADFAQLTVVLARFITLQQLTLENVLRRVYVEFAFLYPVHSTLQLIYCSHIDDAAGALLQLASLLRLTLLMLDHTFDVDAEHRRQL